MTTFKKGDRVRLIDDFGCSAKVGAEATVERVTERFVYVKWLDGSKVNGQLDGGYSFNQFEVVPKGTFVRLTVESFPQGGYVVIADDEPALALVAFTSLPEVTAFLERNMA
jgi:hypothetical protein